MANQNPQSTSGDSLTFDYNQLYAQNEPATPVEEPVQDVVQTNIQQTPVVIPEQQQVEANEQKEKVTNVIPTFDTNVLEGNEAASNQSLINSIHGDQTDDAEYKKNLLFIAVFFGVLIVAVIFLFPILAGY